MVRNHTALKILLGKKPNTHETPCIFHKIFLADTLIISKLQNYPSKLE